MAAGLRVDISDQKANNVDIWIESTTGAGNSRFTFDPAEEVVGVWSRDGSMVAYRAAIGQGLGIYLKRATGLEREKEIIVIPHVDDGRSCSQFLVLWTISKFYAPADSVRQPPGIAASCWRRADPLFEQQSQRDEWANFSRWKMGGLCLR